MTQARCCVAGGRPISNRTCVAVRFEAWCDAVNVEKADRDEQPGDEEHPSLVVRERHEPGSGCQERGDSRAESEENEQRGKRAAQKGPERCKQREITEQSAAAFVRSCVYLSFCSHELWFLMSSGWR